MAQKQTSKRKTSQKSAARPWFIKVRGSYLPNSWQGWLTYIPFMAYLVAVMVTVNNQTSSWLMKAMMITVQFIAAGVVMTWVAASHL
jgi:hypothetical protein